jgi:hypothetical protein
MNLLSQVGHGGKKTEEKKQRRKQQFLLLTMIFFFHSDFHYNHALTTKSGFCQNKEKVMAIENVFFSPPSYKT